MGESRRASELVQRVGRDALRLLRDGDAVPMTVVASTAHTSRETAKRAIEWLRDQGANMEYVPRRRAWRLVDLHFALPLAEPTVDDLQAALTAAGLLGELGQEKAAGRARALFDELAQRMSGHPGKLRKNCLRVSQTTSQLRNPAWMLLLLRAARREVVRITNWSPWSGARSTHDFEPWQVWLHDGVLYVRGFSRTRKAARTFRLANVEHVDVLSVQKPRAPVPTDPWAGDDPRYGLDNDRPGEARIRFRGRVADWIRTTRWHERQEDAWNGHDHTLERRLPYRSCRELARRLVGLGDGIQSVEPDDLRRETLRIAHDLIGAIGDRPKQPRRPPGPSKRAQRR